MIGGLEDMDYLVVDRPIDKLNPVLWEQLELLKIPVIDENRVPVEIVRGKSQKHTQI